ncbi:NADH dehydrogenase [ubiquinone] 1 alpha subcomplex subunit 2 isoform 2-T2 [Glossophaga mutica]
MAAAAVSRGVGARLGLREIRIHLCQRSPGSQGVRDFIEKRYVELKKANPDLPILIRECSEVQPKLWARYAPTVQRGYLVTSLSLQHLAKRRMSL